MGLSEYERMVLRRLALDLDRQDPRLQRQLTEFMTPPEPRISWRPPRVGVVVAAVVLAAMTFMLAMVTMLMRPPCRAGATGAEATTASTAPPRPAGPSGRHPRTPAQDAGKRAVAPSSPATC